MLLQFCIKINYFNPGMVNAYLWYSLIVFKILQIKGGLVRRVYFTAFLWFLLLYFANAAGADTFSCLACHSAMKGKIKAEKGLIDVNVDSEKYAQSVHGGIDCIACHKQFSANPHQPQNNSDIPADISALANSISHKAKTDPVAVAACTECHGGIY